MKKIVILLILISYLFSFSNQKVKNLIGEDKYNTYNQLLAKIFTKQNYSIEEILEKLKNNGLLDLFFKKAKIINTKFIFLDRKNIFDNKILNDSLISLGYYYFYPAEVSRNSNFFMLNIEFKSEHFIDPVLFIKEMNSRGCKVLDVYRNGDVFNYKFTCDPIIKEAKLLTSKPKKYITAKGVYWITNKDFSKIFIMTKRIDYWHPSVWFYDKNLNLLDNNEINKRTYKLTLDIPANCKYIKIKDIYSGENFKRGIIVKGLK